MARVTSIIKLSGKASGLVFCTRNDKSYVRRPTSLSEDRWWRHRRLAATRDRAIEFGGASQLAHGIRSQIPAPIRKLAHPYAHNQLLNALRKSCNAHCKQLNGAYPGPKTRYLNTFSAEGIADAITGLQLGNAPSESAPIATIHGSAITIYGLQSHAHSLSLSNSHSLPFGRGAGQAPMNCRGGVSTARIEFRIHICYARIGEFRRSPHAALRRAGYTKPDGSTDFPLIPANSSDWAPVTGIDPISDRIDITGIVHPVMPSPKPGEQLLVFLAIEWRQRTGKRVKLLKSMSTFQGLAAIPLISADDAPARRPAQRPRTTRRAHPRPMIKHRTANPPVLSPAQRLQAALRALAPPA